MRRHLHPSVALVRRYYRDRPTYQCVCDKAADQIVAMLKRCGIPFASVNPRVKTWSSLSEHLSRRLVEPSQVMTSVHDTAGVRIVLWRPRDRTDLAHEVHELFQVHHSKEGALRNQRDGYRDDKYYCSLRRGPSISAQLVQIRFELQVQTAMMNAWASASHDVAYKPAFQLPDGVKKRFALLAALTELADDNMGVLTEEIAAHAYTLSENELNALGLKRHLDALVSDVDTRRLLERTFHDHADGRRLIVELRKCGVTRLDDLKKTVDSNAIRECLSAIAAGPMNYSDVVRLILMRRKAQNYFGRVAPDVILLDNKWLRILKSFNVDYRGIARRLGKPIYVSNENGFRRL